MNASHNYEPSMDISRHSSCRRFSKEEIMHVKEITRGSVVTHWILSSTRQNNPRILIVSKNIYNMKAKTYKDYLTKHTIIEAIFEELV